MNDGKINGVVLAGGEGKRLRPLTYYFQKGMIPIGSEQKPLLEYIILLLKKYNVKDITLLVGYKNEQIKNYFNHGQRFGVNIQYFLDNPEMGGSGGALLNAWEKGAFNSSDVVLVYYGDIISKINLSQMIEQHVKSGADATLALTNGYQVPVGVAKLEGKTVLEWVEKPEINISAGIGIVALSKSVYKYIRDLSKGKGRFDIMGDVLPYLLENELVVEAFLTEEFWYDVGSTEKYEKLNNGLVDRLLK